MEGFSHQGSLVYINLQKTSAEIKQIAQQLQQKETDKSLLLGISQLNEGGLIVRVLGHRQSKFRNSLRKLVSS